ncbi:MAG: biopolymer transporter ExbD, partial [Gammaproteobacteria bacterium]|nr:biopolymer transporter ExbD [Gammaproteobacteria bacterium]
IPSLTPLIDIVFLLLVFFMLTAHFVKDEALDISLPEADSASEIADEGALEIVLDNQGHILIDKKHVDATELNKVLQQQLHGRKNKQVILRGDQIAQLGLTVSVMDAARKAGATSLDIVTRKP